MSKFYPGHAIAVVRALKSSPWAAAGGKGAEIRPKPIPAGSGSVSNASAVSPMTALKALGVDVTYCEGTDLHAAKKAAKARRAPRAHPTHASPDSGPSDTRAVLCLRLPPTVESKIKSSCCSFDRAFAEQWPAFLRAAR